MILSLSLLASILVSDSLTVSPLSFTYHNFQDKEVEALYARTVSTSTTWHPGVHLKYEHRYLQALGWYFKDSFDGHAGGLALGPKLDIFSFFTVGLVGGVYSRVHHDETPMKFPLTSKMGPLDISPIGMVTGSIKIPVTKTIALDVNANSAWKITNFGMGINFRW